MASDNIFQQYLQPPKSVAEYSAEYDQNDARKQSLQQNALTLAAGQQKFGETQQAGQRAAQLRAALIGLPQGATDDQRVQAMRGTGTPEGFAAADALDKSLVERKKGLAAAGKDEADTAKTTLARDVALHDYHAQKLATVRTPEDALAWAQEGQALGVFSQPGQYDRGVATIQQAAQSPEAFAKWRDDAMRGGQSVTEQLKQKLAEVQQTEQVRQFGVTDQRIQSEGAASRAVQVRGQNVAAGTASARLAFDKEKEAGTEDSALGPMATRMIAQQYLAGDNTALGNIGRGTQGAKNLTIVRNEVARQANAAGMNGADIAAKMAEFGGMKAGQRTLGTRTANIEVAAAEAAELAPLALAASLKVPRSGALPFGKLQVMFDANTNDPDIREFAMANTALVNAYGQVMSRGGAATVSDKTHAAELLSTAFDQPSYARAVAQLQREIQAAQRAPGKVRTEMSAATSGRPGGHAAPAAATPGAKPSLSDIFN